MSGCIQSTQVSKKTSVSGVLRIWGPAPLTYGAGQSSSMEFLTAWRARKITARPGGYNRLHLSHKDALQNVILLNHETIITFDQRLL
jgi:hypothetical protein